MATLTELRAKFGFKGGSYDPKPDCKFCKGTGEKTLKSGKTTFCICLFVGHDMSDLAGETLAATAKKLRNELSR